MVPYFETGLQPPNPTVSYLETGGSNGSLFRNCLQPQALTAPCLETGDSNSSLFRKCLQPPSPVTTVHYLETVCNPLFQRFHI